MARASSAQAPVATVDELLSPRPVNRSLGQFPVQLLAALRMGWAAAPRELLTVSILEVLSGAGMAAQILVVREVLVVVLGEHGHLTMGKALPYLAVLAGVTVAVRLATTVAGEVGRLLGGKLEAHAMCQVADAAAGAELVDYERPEYHNALRRAQVAASTRPVQMTNSLTGSLAMITGIAGVGAALIKIQPLLLGLLALGSVPVWYTTRLASRALYRFAVEQTEPDRRRNYLFLVMTHRDTAGEVRAFSLFRFLRQQLTELYGRRIADLAVLVRRRVFVTALGGLSSAAVTFGTLALVIWLVTKGRLALSSAGAAAGAVIILGSRIHGLGTGSAGLYENTLYMQDFTTFVRRWPSRMKRGRRSVPLPTLSSIQARDVVFRYPAGKEPALRGVSIEIAQDEVVALVGENGSGKTTLAKVLAGLYQPDAGAVAWNGHDLGETDAESLRRSTAVIFQEYGKYMMTAARNIGIGDVARLNDREGIVRAAQRAQADRFIESLPTQYDHLLGSEFFGGANLSVGQWQRIALARAYFRDAPFIILDEPTASLDPKAEAALFDSVRSLYKGRSVLLISHRFGSARAADRIYVLHEGQVIESGTHDELMDLGGRYAEMFLLQAAAYGALSPRDHPLRSR